MKGEYKVKSTNPTPDGHKRITLNKPIAGKVILLVDGQEHYRDSIESARWLAHRIIDKKILRTQKRRGLVSTSIEYRMIIPDLPISELPEIGSIEDECRRIELAEKRKKGIGPKVIIERYPEGKPVHGFPKGQAGRPETNRRRF